MAEKIDVVIPSATLVPEQLRNIGNLPGIIYPINQKIVFDYLYNQYKNISGNIDIICYQEKEKVHRRLSAYNDNKICIKDLDSLDDLGHTIYFALKDKKNTVVINFADTIIMDEKVSVDNDAIFYSEDHVSDVWTFFEIEDGVITSIYDKENIISAEKKKLFTGLFVIKDCELFCDCLEKAFVIKNSSMSSFYYALCVYSKLRHIDAVKVENWFDIGHADTYYNSKLEVRAREFNHIEIDKNRGILRKTSDAKEKFIGEILWYLKLPTDIEYVRPRIFSYSTNYDNPYVEMEYYAYHTIHELFLYSDLSYNQWNDVFKRIKFVFDDFERYKVEGNEITTALEEIYLTKTLQRLEKIKNDTNFSSFFDKNIVINEVEYLSLNEIINLLKELIPQMLYDVKKFNIIHGDLCFANIMVDSTYSFIKVIDPRGKFGKYDIYGDSRYELAKLFHSVDGKYDFIIKDLFDIEFDNKNARINYRINERKREFDLYELFLNVFKDRIGDDIKKIELIEALLFLSMIPLHNESINHQMIMLATGINILNRVKDITIKEIKNV